MKLSVGKAWRCGRSANSHVHNYLFKVLQTARISRVHFLLPPPTTQEWGEDRGEGQSEPEAANAPPLPSPLLHFDGGEGVALVAARAALRSIATFQTHRASGRPAEWEVGDTAGSKTCATGRGAGQDGSVLIIVLWVAFGLVALALYFAHSMSFELRASDNRVASIKAEQAIAGAARYVSNILVKVEEPGTLPDILTYRSEAARIGDATFWLIGQGDLQTAIDLPVFGLVDEASKLNLNTATVEMLQLLPGMTAELAAAIKDWRDSDDEVSEGGAESQVYGRLNPSYKCKNANFESIDELRLVTGAHLDILFGEDANLNGILDPNENDGDVTSPTDNRDGRLDAGLLQYVTVYSRQPNTRTNVNDQQQLAPLLREKLSTERANQVLARVGSPPGGFRSLLQFYILSGLTAEEFATIEGSITTTNSSIIEGLINVNTASEAVLACIPGIGIERASSLVAYRHSNLDQLTSIAWVKDAIDPESAIQAGPYLTAQSYQFTADVAAVGHHGRGYRRTRFVFDTSEGEPKIIYRQDLSHLGWALGKAVRDTLKLAKDTR